MHLALSGDRGEQVQLERRQRRDPEREQPWGHVRGQRLALVELGDRGGDPGRWGLDGLLLGGDGAPKLGLPLLLAEVAALAVDVLAPGPVADHVRPVEVVAVEQLGGLSGEPEQPAVDDEAAGHCLLVHRQCELTRAVVDTLVGVPCLDGEVAGDRREHARVVGDRVRQAARDGPDQGVGVPRVDGEPVGRAQHVVDEVRDEARREVHLDVGEHAGRGATSQLGPEPPFDAARADEQPLRLHRVGQRRGQQRREALDERLGVVGAVDVQHGRNRRGRV